MSDNNNLYLDLSDGKNNMLAKGKKVIQKYLIYIVLLFNIAVRVVLELYQVGFLNPFTISFILELIVSTITTFIAYICFIPFGKTDELKRNVSIGDNLKLWSNLSEAVRKGCNDLFRFFCREQIAYERREARELILGNNTLIPYSTYEEKYMGKKKSDINKLVKSGELTKKEAKAINRANGHGAFNPTRVKPINPIIILSGVRKRTINDAGRSNSSYIAKWLAQRPILIFISTTALNTISTTFIGTENAVLEILLAVMSIVLASVCGYSAGQEDVREQNERVLSRILFLSLFEEKKEEMIKLKEKRENEEKLPILEGEITIKSTEKS